MVSVQQSEIRSQFMDNRSSEAYNKIRRTTGVTVSREEDPLPIWAYSLTLTSNQAIDMFGIPLPYTVVLRSPCPDTLRHKVIIEGIVRTIAAHC